MVTIMDMTTGEALNQFDRYGDEVLNASWLPQPMLEAGLQSAVSSTRATLSAAMLADPDSFLKRLYLSQE